MDPLPFDFPRPLRVRDPILPKKSRLCQNAVIGYLTLQAMLSYGMVAANWNSEVMSSAYTFFLSILVAPLAAFALCIYFAPSIIAAATGYRWWYIVFGMNCSTGWTGIGWLYLMGWVLFTMDKEKP